MRQFSRKSGSIYFLTLAAATVLVAILMGFSLVILQFRSVSRSNSAIEQAELQTEMGLRHAIHFTCTTPTWRELLPQGAWLTNISVDNATYSVWGVDSDNSFMDDLTDSVSLTCTVQINDITRNLSVAAQNAPTRLFQYGLAASGQIIISNHARIVGNILANNNISKSGAETWVFGAAYAAGTINTSTQITQGIYPNNPAAYFPDNATIMNYYRSRATNLIYSPRLEKIVISPASAPGGQLNPDGIYAINCNGNKIEIRNCRIRGTLILINPRADSIIYEGIVMESASPNLPVLLIDGPYFSICSDRDLNEALNFTDFNLPGESGYGSRLQSFSSQISGLIYSSGTLDFEQSIRVKGTALSGNIIYIRDNAYLEYNSNLPRNPPPALLDFYLIPGPGSYRSISNK